MQPRFLALPVFSSILLAATPLRAVEKHFLSDKSTASVLPVTESVVGSPVQTGVTQVWSVAYDPYEDTVYSTDIGSGRILRTSSNGANPEVIVEIPGAVLRGLAVDSRANRLYYLNSDTDTLNVCRLDGKSPEVLFSGFRRPNDMALDPLHGKLYVTDSGTNGVLRYDIDSGTSEWIMSGAEVDGVWGIALLPEDGLMFLSDHVHNAIMRADLAGQGLTTLVADMETPRGLTVAPHHGRLYWLEADTGRFYRSDLDGSGVTSVLGAPLAGLRDLCSFESTDKDGDFLDDEWEDQHLGGLTGDPSLDSDGDGQSDEGEFRFGGDPDNPNVTGRVLFEFDAAALGGVLRLSYRERPEPWFTYELMHSEDWTGWGSTTDVVSSVVGYPGGIRTRVLTIDPSSYAPGPGQFFRVNASRQ